MPGLFTLIVSVLAAVLLFLHGLSAFTDEVTRLGGARLRRLLQRLTQPDWRGSLVGAAVTAVVQSSSAVSSMAVGLANRRALTPRGAFAVMIGANVGTTTTAWLVALKVGGLGPVFVTLGGLWSLLGPRKLRPWGKALFYFGLIFLALDWIAQGLAPLGHAAQQPQWRALIDSPVAALMFGAVLTALVQSSSVVSGLAVVSVLEGVIAAPVAVWLIAGANLGTTSTALIAASTMGHVARRLAWLNTGFNALGVLLFATLLQPLIDIVLRSALPAAQQVAAVHTLFNLAAALAVLAAQPLLWPRLQRWIDTPARERTPLPREPEPSANRDNPG